MRSMIYFELKKIFSRRLTIISILLLLGFSVLLNVTTYVNWYAFDGVSRDARGREAVALEKEIAARYEGPLTDEKLRQILSDFEPRYELNGMNAAYIYQNATQSAAFIRFADLDGHWNGLSVKQVFGERPINIGFVDGWISVSKDMARLVVVMALVLTILLSPVYAGEYGGMDRIILSSRYGKSRCPKAKLAAAVIAALVLTSLTVGLHLSLALCLYGVEGLDSSILFCSADHFESIPSFALSCAQLLGYQISLAYSCAIGLCGICLLISALSAKEFISLVASAAAFLLPVVIPLSEKHPLFRVIALFPLHQALSYPLMSIAQFQSGQLYALLALPFSLFLFLAGAPLSCRLFARHQVN